MQNLPRRWLYLFVLLLIALSTFVSMAIWQIRNEFFINTYTQHARRIVLVPGANGRSLITILKDAQLIQSPRYLALLFRWYRISPQLKAGTYLLSPGDTIWSLITKMISSKVLMQQFTIVEGMRLCELVNSWRQSSDFIFNVEQLEKLKDNQTSLEGLFFASSYHYPVGGDILPTLRLAKQALKLHLQNIWQERDPDLPYQNPYELLIAASIIEKETADDHERHLISGVIVNRLRLHMPLQMDPIVAYGLPGCRHVILKAADIKLNSAYNSYRHYGLPPSPIAMVGLSSLLAAAHPSASAYLYFVAKGDGHHYFSKDYRHQMNAINHYLRKQHAEPG